MQTPLGVICPLKMDFWGRLWRKTDIDYVRFGGMIMMMMIWNSHLKNAWHIMTMVCVPTRFHFESNKHCWKFVTCLKTCGLSSWFWAFYYLETTNIWGWDQTIGLRIFSHPIRTLLICLLYANSFSQCVTDSRARAHFKILPHICKSSLEHQADKKEWKIIYYSRYLSLHTSSWGFLHEMVFP